MTGDFPGTRGNPNDFGEHAQAAAAGQTAGDIISVVGGTAVAIAGGAADFVEGLSGVGVVAMPVTTVVAAEGGLTAVTGLKNLLSGNGVVQANDGPKQSFRTKGNKKGTDYVVTPNGEAIKIPDGASGPSNPQRGSGMMYQGGSGGKGMNERVTGVRIMDANRNQGRRVNYMNKNGQTVDPVTGRTISNKDPRGHIPLKDF